MPEVPSAKDVERNGLELGEMNKILLKKIEELTLHLIEKDDEINAERESNKKRDQEFVQLREELADLKKLFKKMLSK